jgi:hypothetical protein
MTPATELLSPAETAARLGVTVNTLETWRCRKRYRLAYIKVGGRVRYSQAAIEAFLKSRTVKPGESNKKARKTQ